MNPIQWIILVKELFGLVSAAKKLKKELKKKDKDEK